MKGGDFIFSSEVFDGLTIFSKPDLKNFLQQCSLVSFVSLPKRSLQYNFQFSFYCPNYEFLSFFHKKIFQKETV